jgi:mitogen-activated protein kinase 1/3
MVPVQSFSLHHIQASAHNDTSFRAPEIMLTFRQYTKAIDIWSVGCILAEILSGGRPLFPGRDYHHQITLILDVLGTPSIEEFAAISSRRSRDYIR